ncbi:MAG: DUF2238 domain-containing protein [Desulfuromonadaceae bacterium]|nr:DUF2238 domain-containing protein [Desulfuromonadaceae bacterium]
MRRTIPLKPLLLSLYLTLWIALAIAPRYREDWLLENLLVFIGLPLAIGLERRYGFSTLGAALLCLFFSLHAVGAHYTYAETPFFSQLSQLIGLERNHFDRLVHFLFGFLLFVPLRDLLHHSTSSGKLRNLLTVLILFSASGLYEIVEWLAAMITHPELGLAFLGTQGDIWDAQKDMTAAHLGTLMAWGLWHKQARIKQ